MAYDLDAIRRRTVTTRATRRVRNPAAVCIRMSLLLEGTQSQYLTSNPVITFFRDSTRQHTPFAIESNLVSFQGDADFGKRCVATVPKTTDLLSNAMLQVVLPDLTQFVYSPLNPGNVAWTNNIGLAILQAVELSLAGNRVDRQYPQYMDALMQLDASNVDKREALNEMLGRFDRDVYNIADPTKCIRGGATLYVPLQFAFCKDSRAAIPLTALNTDWNVTFNFEFANFLACICTDGATVVSALDASGRPPSMQLSLYCDMVTLDTPERNAITQSPSQYLCDTCQFLGDAPIVAPAFMPGTKTTKLRLPFANPVKELIWVYLPLAAQQQDSLTGNRPFAYGNPSGARDCFDQAQLLFNAKERIQMRQGSYFRLIQPATYHGCVPKDGPIYVYSFALRPDDWQPSGEQNMSQISTVDLALALNAGLTGGVVKVYARTINVLRFANGTANNVFTI